MKRSLLAFFALILLSAAAFADIPRPKPSPTPKVKEKKSINTTMGIYLTKTDTAKLKIPRSMIRELRAQLDELDTDGTAAPAVAATGGFSRLQTIVSGGFLSLALVFGGMWFVRSKKAETKAARALAIGAFLFLSGAVATVVLANAGPPDEARSITGKIFSDHVHSYKQASGEIKVVTTDEPNGRLELIVPDPNGFPDRDEE